MNYYENHKPGRWVEYQLLTGRVQLPRFSGAYAIYFDGALVYIGSSTNIANRFSEHKIRHGYAKNIITPWGDVPGGTKVTLKVRRSSRIGDWAMWEIRLIKRIKPMFNRQHRGAFPR